jgi:hypothetical protein
MIRTFLKIIRFSKIDSNDLGNIMKIVMNRNIKFKYKEFIKCIALNLTELGCK